MVIGFNQMEIEPAQIALAATGVALTAAALYSFSGPAFAAINNLRVSFCVILMIWLYYVAVRIIQSIGIVVSSIDRRWHVLMTLWHCRVPKYPYDLNNQSRLLPGA